MVRGNRSGKPMKRKPKQREEKKKLNIKKDTISDMDEKKDKGLQGNEKIEEAILALQHPEY